MPGSSRSCGHHSELTGVIPELVAFPSLLDLPGKGASKERKGDVFGKRKYKGLILLPSPFFADLHL